MICAIDGRSGFPLSMGVEHLQPRCSSKASQYRTGLVPTQFLDYAVKEKMFIYSLTAKAVENLERVEFADADLGGTAWL